ncbi:bifunctional adenosylcobinamide kinase/adenosylcobinamide-phosphate guanylyltransferase [Vibrio parahaemolyticus]|uniref:bifunctional adenosylcobinamide kinase/adenosylcobinamide-phosphate guanylyltransferase n=1 Tax=Vibrio parahaemolyticus TaxID=670 RepID=UPI00042A4DD9|nr:bifunctional adenosylcobinamide kinase/adenosylcobinamide-phosphate guanylyltransferase [Vibrio parahaemolyticus]EIV1706389.1 bifunctional adenosylcobinamide kinase/adenosylcobinamide-phosphate guanylyltransferase [Vibrio parahaemolyticus]ELI5432681.1 bifunctional adenosylcobinamide kinase/adenosylcobinamide-phosphate guanylyltransferase [Vibrio parahaemolyticus]TOI69594.1 adenosylcobinamide kinase/adenosylcobinamide phosphate guanyltransferase [Vibrio parahaemolyticus]HCG7637423.1 bifunctio
MKQLILGGARSGKSKLAEQTARQLSEKQNKSLHYVATALPFDDEMRERIKHHQAQRGEGWHEHECHLRLPDLLAHFDANDVVLVDCLTLWLNNWIFELGEVCSNESLEQEIEKLIQAVENSRATLIFVSNEVGMGIVPLGAVSRYFVDNAGRMNQQLAQVCSRVTFVAAGLPLALKE